MARNIEPPVPPRQKYRPLYFANWAFQRSNLVPCIFTPFRNTKLGKPKIQAPLAPPPFPNTGLGEPEIRSFVFATGRKHGQERALKKSDDTKKRGTMAGQTNSTTAVSRDKKLTVERL